MADLKTYVLGRKNLEDLESDDARDLPSELMTINMGPSHPAMHGTVRIVLTVDGERVVHGDVQPGYLHRCFEKEAEHATYTQIFPYTDRLNYVSPMINNCGYAMAVEKLLGIHQEIPERAEYIRVLVSEVSRVTDHLTCVGASAMELGAFTAFLYAVKAREWFFGLLEELSGARLTYSYVRVGGVVRDLSPGFCEKLEDLLKKTEEVLDEVEGLLNNNRIFRDRMEGVGAFSADDAIRYGLTGPTLRASGVDYDVRKDYPYSVYERFEFDVPVGTTGDCYDRYLVRVEEIKQSIRILRQAMATLPEGPVIHPDPRVAMPEKRETYNTIEAMIRHFKHIVDGIRVPPAEAYCFVEGGNGELGFFIKSDGTGRPYKCYVRSPSFVTLQTVSEIIRGAFISDIVPIFGMINMIGGECDK
ncbi:NADH dehydrogenase (quinone) subunit D [Haliangium ochraceum]|uniref:NADH-quinone oxidoreductase subunit D n=1 Tax=Haliangium ochraceum (strain DSM 14365 / JCM 11303 / SMP-2) TaxID=502025 RepID=D0LPX4_HALO1|nr:NADH dehydrogenase (quinone) subunit D [Haliangium ochraceum]ACY17011.1 NADH dehydrogenase I, D subunit [Haliangium ochraceum DSM 14365]